MRSLYKLIFLFIFVFSTSCFADFTVFGKNYTISKFLGTGREGKVYLVKSEDEKLFVLKKFKYNIDAEKNLCALKKLKRLLDSSNHPSFGVVNIRQIDIDQSIIIYDFVSGIVGDQFFNDETYEIKTQSQDADRARKFYDIYISFVSWLQKQNLPAHLNIVLSPKNVLFTNDDRIVVFDPF